MKKRAKTESMKREPDIRHHFKTDYYKQDETNIIGFYGEFALRTLLNLDWKSGIRTNYETIDSQDILINGWSIDVKTESIPDFYLWEVVQRIIPDNEYYGRRLYHSGQIGLLNKYDILVLGAVRRENSVEEIDAWFPIGWLFANEVKSY